MQIGRAVEKETVDNEHEAHIRPVHGGDWSTLRAPVSYIRMYVASHEAHAVNLKD